MTDSLRTQLQTTLGEAYVLERELGGGGMSRVFIAHEESLGRRVVVKVLPPELAAEVSYERFRREITLAAQLQHPHIVPLLSAGETNGLPFFMMPYVEGESLRTRLARSGELPVAPAIRILREVASALAHAHDRGVAHRDIKPDNVMLSGGSAVVTDFGVAKALSASQRAHGIGDAGVLTSHGIALGTPTYMAPEQAAADPTMDHRVDVYAFGVMAYELLTGQPPFSGRSPHQLLAAHVTETPEPIAKRRPALPPSLAALVMRCLEKRAADRPQSAGELVHLLDAVATPSGGLTPASGMTPWRTSRRLRAIAAGVAIVVVGGAAAFGLLRSVGAARADTALAHRVHVASFVDRTLLPELGAVGPMAADLVTQGLSATGLVEVVQDSAGAGTLVRGTIYRRGDTLQIVAQVTEARTGRVLRSVGPVSALRTDPAAGIEALSERIAGGVAALVDPLLGPIAPVTTAPPTFEAYRQVREGREAESDLDHVSAVGHYLRAAAEGERYMFPLVAAAESYARLGDCASADSLGRTLLARRADMTPYEAYSVDETMAHCRGAGEAAYRAASRKAELAPASVLTQYGVAVAALGVGRHDEAVRVLAGLDAEGPFALRGRVDFALTYAVALHAAGAFDRELALARRLRAEVPDLDHALSAEVRALAALGRTSELFAAVDGASQRTPLAVYEGAVEELRAHRHTEDATRLARRLVDRRRDHAAEDGGSVTRQVALAHAYVAAERLVDARRLADSLVKLHPASASVLALKGRVAARQHDRRAATMVSAMLEGLVVAGDGRRTAPHALARARIAALLGDRDAAVALVAASLEQGEATPLRVREDPDFLMLRDFAPFRRLTGQG